MFDAGAFFFLFMITFLVAVLLKDANQIPPDKAQNPNAVGWCHCPCVTIKTPTLIINQGSKFPDANLL